MSNLTYRINTPAVVFERFADEVVAINLDNGVYYSLTGCASDIFQMIEQVATREEIYQTLAARYDTSAAELEQKVTPFLARMVEEKLICPTEEVRTGQLVLPALAGPAGPLTLPKATAYSDLQNLLLLDPVHDVGEMGWPQESGEQPS